jgi:hypothetical protein
VQATVIRFLKDLPPIFTRQDVFDKLKQVNSEMASKLKPDALRNTMRQLVKIEVIEIVEEKSGSQMAKYRIKAGQQSLIK